MHPSAWKWVRSGFQSLAARVSFFVFAATLTSALAVAGTSAFALRAFLRSKVEQRLPAEVAQLRERLDLWYSQRSLDVQVFARSAVMVDGLARLGRGTESEARREVERYLTYVLEGLPQYSSLFVLDRDGRLVVTAGSPVAIETSALQRLAETGDASVSDLLPDREAGRVQAVSSAVQGRGERGLHTLHAVLRRDALASRLELGEGAQGRIRVFDERGALVASSRTGDGEGETTLPPALREAEPGAFRDYLAADGLRVVGSALPIPRFRWTLLIEEEYEAAFAPIAGILSRIVALNLGIVLGLSGVAFAVVAVLVRPLHTLSECARRLRDGEKDVELPVVRSADEVGVLARSFGEMVASLRRAHEVLEQLAITDGLTKIHNHRFFQDQLTREIRRAERSGEPLSLVLLDIDDFKALNDRYGHAVGDAVLERLAALLVQETRANDLVARYGGEEFAVLAPSTDRSGAWALAEKLRVAIDEATFESPAGPLAITVSMGVACYEGDREAFFHQADRALYAAKTAGKDCCVLASDEEA
jgi:diguanylate cyclase (GGDEF)-like protein